jgi:hypothetical protein
LRRFRLPRAHGSETGDLAIDVIGRPDEPMTTIPDRCSPHEHSSDDP